LQGDYIDKSTSTNDPIFFLHHAFVDMNHVEFQLQHRKGASAYWGKKLLQPGRKRLRKLTRPP
jgi:hypothetical protein